VEAVDGPAPPRDGDLREDALCELTLEARGLLLEALRVVPHLKGERDG
jgi:hypothetical protein